MNNVIAVCPNHGEKTTFHDTGEILEEGAVFVDIQDSPIPNGKVWYCTICEAEAEFREVFTSTNEISTVIQRIKNEWWNNLSDDEAKQLLLEHGVI